MNKITFKHLLMLFAVLCIGFSTVNAQTYDLLNYQAPYTDSSQVDLGSTITVHFTLANGGSATITGGFNVKFVWSQDTLYQAGSDTGYVSNISDDFPSSSYFSSTVPSLPVPTTLTAGDWYILVVCDPANTLTESDETNNVGHTGLVTVIDNGNKPDLDFYTNPVITLSKAIVNPDIDSIIVSYSVVNIGSDSSVATNVAYYLSSNPVLDGGDVLLGEKSVYELAAGWYGAYSDTLAIPPSTADGYWYILFVIDDDDNNNEYNEVNNIDSVLIQVVSITQPDYSILFDTVTPVNTYRDSTVSILCYVQNIAITTTDSSNIKFYLSQDITLDGGDVLIGTGRMPGLVGGGYTSVGFQYQIPDDLAYGTWYVLFVADANNELSEISELNNSDYMQIEIIDNSGIDDNILHSKAINIYPNPAKDFVNISFERPVNDKVNVSVMNSMGEVISSQNEINLSTNNIPMNLSGLSKGTYFINIRTNDKSVTKKLIIVE